MADELNLNTDPFTASDTTGVTWGDYGKAALSGAETLGSNAGAIARYSGDTSGNQFGSALGKWLQGTFTDAATDTVDGMSPAAKQRIQSAVTSPEFWAHPFSASMLKGTQMAPAAIAAMVPGVFASDAIAATMLTAAAGGTINAGQVVDDIDKQVDAASDDDLKKASTYYAGLRSMGYSEQDARKDYANSIKGYKPAMAALIGALAGAAGPSAAVARGIAGKEAGTSLSETLANSLGKEVPAASSRLGAAGAGAGEGALAMGAQSGADDYMTQSAAVEGGLKKEIDPSEMLSSIIDGSFFGGVMGGAAGGALHKSPAKDGVTGTGTGSERKYPKGGESAVTPKGTSVEAVSEIGPDAAAKAALQGTTKVASTGEPAETPPAPPATPVAEPSKTPAQPPSLPTDAPVSDAGKTVPEAPATLAKQGQDLQSEDSPRKAVLYPKNGPKAPKVPEEMAGAKTKDGVVHYDPEEFTPEAIFAASKAGKLNEVLGLGPVSKDEAVARVQQGETPVAITERTAGGTEVKAAAGTTETAPAQVASLEEKKTPGNTVQVEKPEAVIAGRQAANAGPKPGRVLQDVTPEGKANAQADAETAAEIAKRIQKQNAPEKGATGKNWTKEQRTERARQQAVAEDLMAKNPPQAGEFALGADEVTGGRNKTVARAKAIVAEAERQGVEIPKRIADSKDEGMNHSPAMIWLSEAKALASRKVNKLEHFNRFAEREVAARAGDREALTSARRVEGDAAKRQTGEVDIDAPVGKVADALADHSTPETALEAKQEGDIEDAPLPSDREETEAKIKQAEAEEAARREAARSEGFAPVQPPKAAAAVAVSRVKNGRVKLDVGPKVEGRVSIGERIKAARADTNTTPTEAQKAAGNYRKGRVTIEGNKVALENPKGSVRSGVDENGKPWSTKMPGDYGEFTGTKGADGDPIDVLHGPQGETGKAFVINQRDPKTGTFDEHKVVTGVKDEAEARTLYAKSFSDGSGPKRVHSVVELGRDELREWLHRGDTSSPISEDRRTTLWGDKEHAQETASPIATDTLADHILGLQQSGSLKGKGVSGVMMPVIAKKLMELVGHIEVHTITHEDMLRLTGDHYPGYYDTTRNHIVLRPDLSEAIRVHTILHEGIHALTERGMARDPAFKEDIRSIMQEILSQHGEDAYPERPQANEEKLLATHYAFKDEYEFMSEALSNGALQEVLARTQISPELASRLGIRDFRAGSLWSAVIARVRMMLGLPRNAVSALEAAMSVADRLSWEHNPDLHGEFYDRVAAQALSHPHARFIKAIEETGVAARDPKRGYEEMLAHPVTTAGNAIHGIVSRLPAGATKEVFYKFLSNDQLRQAKEYLFGAKGEKNPMRVLTDTVEKMGVRMREYRAEATPIIRDMAIARTKYAGEVWDHFSALAHDATMYEVHPDASLADAANAHLRLAKDAKSNEDGAMRGWQSREKHPELFERFQALPKELKDLWHRSQDYFKEQQEGMKRGAVENILEGAELPKGVTKAEMVERVLNGTMSDDDIAHFEKHGAIGNALNEADELKLKKGAYFPLMRHGDYVLHGDYTVPAPANAKRISDNVLEFSSRKEAHAYVAKSELPAKASKVWYDSATGERVATMSDAISTVGHPVDKYHVTVQHKHVEFFDKEHEAHQRRQELLDTGKLDRLAQVDKREQNPNVDYSMSSSQTQRLIDNVRKNEALSASQKGLLEKSLIESSVSMRSGARIEKQHLPRRNVAGASDDLVRNLTTYSTSSAQYRSRQDFRTMVDGALEDMRKVTREGRYSDDQLDRSRVFQELETRLNGFGSPEYGGKVGPVWQRVMALSFIKRMASTAHLMLHMTHPYMISLPVLSARHGGGEALRQLTRAYGDMGWRSGIGEGVSGAIRLAKDSAANESDFIGTFRRALAKAPDGAKLGKMIDALMETGHIHPDAGYEVSRFGEQTSKFDRGLSKVDAVFRQLTGATESINRVAEAVTAYRLEMVKNKGDHDAAVRYTKDTLANTQGLYSATNAAAVFRNPAVKPFLQFKQFPQMIYHLLGKSLYDSFKGETPEVKREALRTFLGVVGSHAAMAGALGLPMEVIKTPVMLANALGVTNTSWEDLEDKAQRGAAGILGPQVAEVFMHGLSHALGPFSVDVHHRLGLNSLLMFGEPDGPNNALHWLEDTLGGAPMSMLADTFDAAEAAKNGDYAKAFEKITPFKQADDIVKAIRLGEEGKPTKQGKGMAPINVPEMLTQALGFKPASVAQYDTARRASQKEVKAEGDARRSLIQGYAAASSAGARAIAIGKIREFNQSHPDSQISTTHLSSAQSHADDETILGQRVNTRNRETLEDYQKAYNIQ